MVEHIKLYRVIKPLKMSAHDRDTEYTLYMWIGTLLIWFYGINGHFMPHFQTTVFEQISIFEEHNDLIASRMEQIEIPKLEECDNLLKYVSRNNYGGEVALINDRPLKSWTDKLLAL